MTPHLRRRVITISRKKWGKSTVKTEKTVRDAIVRPEVESDIEEYLKKSRSVTSYELAHRFGIRMSVARQILRKKESEGLLVPYVKDGGFEAYTSPSELSRKETERPILIADVLEEISSSIPKESLFTDEVDAALEAAARMDAVVKPGRLARQRRDLGVRKEQKKERRPEVVVQPLEEEEEERVEPEDELGEDKPAARKKPAPKKTAEDRPKKEPAKKAPKEKPEVKPKKSAKKVKDTTAEDKSKKTTKKAEEKPKKTIEKAEEKPKKTAKKVKDTTAEDKSKKTTKKAEEKPKRTTKKSAPKKKSD